MQGSGEKWTFSPPEDPSPRMQARRKEDEKTVETERERSAQDNNEA